MDTFVYNIFVIFGNCRSFWFFYTYGDSGC